MVVGDGSFSHFKREVMVQSRMVEKFGEVRDIRFYGKMNSGIDLLVEFVWPLGLEELCVLKIESPWGILGETMT